ncbi:MAG TPA: tyrosine-type recombinase/integrase, partial [Thermodesulfovibrio thiophilus]|nr:tyrosine-type recombinase/integrase [Thermodesulfovibrio thiophilus]
PCYEASQILKELYERRNSKWVFSNTDNPVLSIRRALKTAAKRASITRTVTPNMIRHTFATTALMAVTNVVCLNLSIASECLNKCGHILLFRLAFSPVDFTICHALFLFILKISIIL